MDKIRKCLKCGTEFSSNRSVKKFCGKQCRETHWVENNRDRLNLTVRNYRARRYAKEGKWREEGAKAIALKNWMIEIKSKPCHDCGITYDVCCMDFDHIDGTEKTYNVGSMFAHHYSKELIEKELDKCELVCANCHRIRTKIRRTGNGRYQTK